MRSGTVTEAVVLRVRGGRARRRADALVTEEPMEIRAAGPGREPVPVAVTMQTPGADFDLAAGFLFTEGLIAGPGEVASIDSCDLPPDEQQPQRGVAGADPSVRAPDGEASWPPRAAGSTGRLAGGGRGAVSTPSSLAEPRSGSA